MYAYLLKRSFLGFVLIGKERATLRRKIGSVFFIDLGN